MNSQNKKFALISLAVICAVGFLAYANSLGNEFVWDDEYIVENNPQIRSFSNLPQAFSSGLFQAYGVGKGSFYRPLQIFTYMIDYRLWGLNPFGYHLSNIILHLLCSLVLYIIITYTSGDWRAAFIACLLFIVHPLHTQAVTYISGRADVLSVLLMLLALLSFMRFRYLLSLAFFVLAMLSREAAVAFVLFLPLYLFSFYRKLEAQRIRRMFYSLIPFFAASLIYVALRYTMLNFFEGTFLAETPLYLRFLTTCKNVFAYLGLLAYPQRLHIERDVIFVGSMFEPKVLFSILALMGIFIWLLWLRRKNAAFFFFAAWFFVGLAPFSNLFPLNATIAEHWMYLPSMGVFALAGIAAVRLLDLAKRVRLSFLFRLEIVLLIIAGLLSYAAVTIKRNQVWATPLSLFSDAKKYVPGNYKIRNNLGNVYLEQGDLNRAIEEYEQSIKIQPLYAQAHSNLGLAYATKGCRSCWHKAVEEYKKALDLVPGLCKTYGNLAKLYIKMGKKEQALETYQQGVTVCPWDAFLHSLYGLDLAEAARLEQALAEGKEALRLDEQNATLHYNMAIIYEYNAEGLRYGPGFALEEAREEYKKATSLNPGYQSAFYNLAILYEFNANGLRYGEGFSKEKAQQYYQKVLRLDPADENAKNNLEYLSNK